MNKHLASLGSLAVLSLAGTLTIPALALAQGGLSSPFTITVHADQPGAKVNPAMWGIFFEDINLGADGGLYAELVKNRSFEFTNAIMGWTQITNHNGGGDLDFYHDDPVNLINPRYLRVTSTGPGDFGVANEGFRGMGVKEGDTYDFSTQARAADGTQPNLRVEIADGDGKVLASGKLSGLTTKWQKQSLKLTPSGTEAKAHLNVYVEGKGTVDLDNVSLFPEKTWKNRPGGLRADMVQLLADLHPGFLRFPGGCIVEGSILDRRYQWKNTIGPIENRKYLINRWNYEFKHRPTPDYYQSFGLGFLEFFQLCEDIGAEPLPIINCGMACQFNSGQLVALDQLQPFIQDALDLIEFANGPAASPWGSKRAAMGHPQPFNMKMMGVGNEQWGPDYIDRYLLFVKAIKARYPGITLVSDAGPSPADDRFAYLWPKMIELKAEMVDQHCYANPIWFLANSHRYDDYDRGGPKIFMGEYAAQSVAIVSPDNKNNLECALAEGAYMTGLERNADVVRMASYAPLFAHIDGWQWTPNLIWVDNLRAYGTPNYYVQQLFSCNRGDEVLPVELTAVTVPTVPGGGIRVGTSQSTAEFKDMLVTRNGEKLFSSDAATGYDAWKTNGGDWQVVDGALRQASTNGSAEAWIDAPGYQNYDFTLKARKIDGRDGFQISVRDDNSLGYRVQWNLGGFTNHLHGFSIMLGQQEQQLGVVRGTIESNRWYDVRMELRGQVVKYYLDGQLIHTADIPAPQVQRLYASATRDDKTGEIILKVVNPSQTTEEVVINLAGAGRLAPTAKQILLTGTDRTDVNSLDSAKTIAPVESTIGGVTSSFAHSFLRNSMTVFRFKTN